MSNEKKQGGKKSNSAGWRRIRLVIAGASLVPGEYVKLDSHQTHYLTTVLRKSEGQDIYLCDGAGAEARCNLLQQGKFAVLEVIEPSLFASADAKRVIHVGQGIAPRSCLDWAVEKMTEAGVASITPLSDYATKRRDSFKGSEKRWERIASGATAQCGRMSLPAIGMAKGLKDWSGSLPEKVLRLQLAPGAKRLLSDIVRPINSETPIALIVGRTSGLTAEEEKAAENLGFAAAGLGERVLRTETVGAVASAVVLAASGEY